MSSKSQAGARITLQLPAGAANTESNLQFQKRPPFLASVAATPAAITVAAMATQVLRDQTEIWYYKMMSVMTVQRSFRRDCQLKPSSRHCSGSSRV